MHPKPKFRCYLGKPSYMLSKRISKLLYNPVIGISPLLLFSVLIIFRMVESAMLISVFFCTLMVVFSLWLAGRRVYQLLIITSLFTLLFFESLTLFLSPVIVYKYSMVLMEAIFICCLAVMKMLEGRMHKFVDNNLKISLKISVNPALQIYFFVSKLLLIFLPIHLVLLLIYKLLFLSFEGELGLFLLRSLFPLLIIFIGVVEYLNLKWMGKQYKEERFVPVVDDNSRVVGHIALSESLAHSNKFMHPLVRVLLKYDGKLYLKERPRDYPFEPCTVCLPLEDYVNYGENVEEAVKRLLHKHFGKVRLNPRFILKYEHETADRKTLNYLYLLSLDNDKLLKTKDMKGGKLWTEKQIVDNLHKKYFSNAFETEFEYIQSTILLAEKYD